MFTDRHASWSCVTITRTDFESNPAEPAAARRVSASKRILDAHADELQIATSTSSSRMLAASRFSAISGLIAARSAEVKESMSCAVLISCSSLPEAP